MSTLAGQDGQALVLSTLFLAVLLGLSAFVLDVGSWYRADRDTQLAADAAALAAAQELPHDPGLAATLATQYADKNRGGLVPAGVSFGSNLQGNDTVSVSLTRPAPGFFAKVFGIDSVTVGARATARTGLMSSAKWVAPFGVDDDHPLISGGSCPCFGQATTLDLEKVGPGAFRIINLDGSHGGTGPGTLADWIQTGLNAYMPLGWYYSDPGAKFNSSQVKNAMQARIGTELLFPVYSVVTGNGANARYNVIGWVGFDLTGFDFQGSSGEIFGSFTRVVWEGLQATSGGNPDFGAHTIELVD